MTKIKKAIIPAAGLGTRFLPATKSIPKEMLPIVDKPILFYIVEEAVRAGIEDIIIIAGRGKSAIEDFFDHSYELEDSLTKSGKEYLLTELKSLRDRCNIISIRQKQALGLGHAVLCGAPVVGKESFAVLLGDEIMFTEKNQPTVLEQLVKKQEEHNQSVVAVMNVAKSEVVKYGIVDVEPLSNEDFKVKSVVEKPSIESAPSQLALPGRYVFDAALFDYIKETPPGKNGEIQLTDAMTTLAKKNGLMASLFKGLRYDAGDKLGYLTANVEMGLRHPEVGANFKSYLLDLCAKI